MIEIYCSLAPMYIELKTATSFTMFKWRECRLPAYDDEDSHSLHQQYRWGNGYCLALSAWMHKYRRWMDPQERESHAAAVQG